MTEPLIVITAAACKRNREAYAQMQAPQPGKLVHHHASTRQRVLPGTPRRAANVIRQTRRVSIMRNPHVWKKAVAIDTRIVCLRPCTEPLKDTNRSRRRRRDVARGPGLPPGATIAARAALKDIGGRMSESENGAPKAPDKAMQHALLKEKRAHETCERLRAQCKTQASLMCRLFATKLQEQQAICARAISAPPGERAQVQAEADAFGASTRWILEEAAAAGLAQARDKEVEALREENETLRKKVSELETKLIDNNAIIIEPEEPQSSLLMRRLEDKRDKCRDEARAARGRVLELEGGMNARQAVDGEVAALRREVAALRASSNGHTVDPDEIKRLKKEHKAALKAALRDGGSSSEREKEELMAAMEREVEQARSRRPFTPSTRLVAIARCRGWFIF